MPEELRECPFCMEDEGDMNTVQGAEGCAYAVRCEYCGAYGPWAKDKAGAVTAWNERRRRPQGATLTWTKETK